MVESYEALRAKWASWMSQQFQPEDWERNLWGEFFALLRRREVWRGYNDLIVSDLDEATRRAAKWLHNWLVRNYVEAQASAIRRFASASRGQGKPVSFGLLLSDIAANPSALPRGDEAHIDLRELGDTVDSVRVFVNKQVAHLDEDHGNIAEPMTFGDLDVAIDGITVLYSKWFLIVTGGVVHSEPDIDAAESCGNLFIGVRSVPYNPWLLPEQHPEP